MVATKKMALFWIVAPSGLVEVYRRFRGASRHHHKGPDDLGGKHLWNVDKSPPDYTAH
jgi:hypothetical protein